MTAADQSGASVQGGTWMHAACGQVIQPSEVEAHEQTCTGRTGASGHKQTRQARIERTAAWNRKREMRDAPTWFDVPEAEAWAAGYNEAVRSAQTNEATPEYERLVEASFGLHEIVDELLCFGAGTFDPIGGEKAMRAYRDVLLPQRQNGVSDA